MQIVRIKTATNIGLKKKRVQCLNEALCFVSSSVLAEITSSQSSDTM